MAILPLGKMPKDCISDFKVIVSKVYSDHSELEIFMLGLLNELQDDSVVFGANNIYYSFLSSGVKYINAHNSSSSFKHI